MDKTTSGKLRLAFAGHATERVRSVPWHAHQTAIFIWYTHGRGRIVFHDREFVFARDSVACVPAGVEYAEHAPRGFISLYVALHGLVLAEPEVVELGEDPRYALCARLVLEESRRAQREATPHAADDLLPLLVRCLRLRRAAPPHHPLVTAALELIATHAGDPAFTIASTARRVGTTVRALRARFAAELRVSPQQYLAEHRIDEARRLLDHGGFPVRVVAARVGFADPYYFSRAFAKRVGMSPTAYRVRRR